MTLTRLAPFALAALLSACTPSATTVPTPDRGGYDVVIENGRLVDGTGNPWMWGDVGIRGDRIVGEKVGADLVCHVGDIADGTVEVRELQATPLASVNATLSRVYVTGNHEYFSEAEGWLDYMESIGWAALHNRHVIVERGGDRLVVAGVDDATAQSSGVRGHRADLEAALAHAPMALRISASCSCCVIFSNFSRYAGSFITRCMTACIPFEVSVLPPAIVR